MNSQLKAVTLFCIVTSVSIFLDIQVVRQILGFCFLSFVPGYLLLRLLKLTGKNTIETIIFSIGLSISYLMFTGLLLNQIYVTLDFPGLLSTPSLFVVFGSVFVLLALCHFTESEKQTSLGFSEKFVSTASSILVLCFLPIIGIAGAVYHSSLLTIVMILGIAALFVLSVTWRRTAIQKVFPLLILSASLALLFNTILVSKYFLGTDVFSEFHVYRTVAINGFWLPSGPMSSYNPIDSLNSLLSITILPAIYTNVTGIGADVLFKIFYPFVFSLVPLALYRMYEQQMDKKSALLSVFFFVSISIAFFGFEPLSLNRQIVGQFFLIMLILILSDPQLVFGKKQVLLIVFGAAVIVSHYSMAYILLVYLALFYVFSRIKIFPFRKASMQSLYLGTIVLMAVLTFSWYVYVSGSPLSQLGQSISHITRFLVTDFGDLGARGLSQGALQPLSPFAATTFLGSINKGLVYIENLFIAIGIFALIVKPDEFNLHSGYRLVALLSGIFLLLGFTVPNLASTLNMTRFYAILIPFLAPFIMLGCTFTLRFIQKSLSRYHIRLRHFSVRTISLCIITFVLTASFLFQTGFIGHITNGYPYSYSLDLARRESSSDISIRIDTHSSYFLDEEVLSATWLQEHLEPSAKVYSDPNAYLSVLISYAHLPYDRSLDIGRSFAPSAGTYVYLKYMNVRMGLVYLRGGDLINVSDLQPGLERCGKIYSNGDSELWYSP